MTVRLSVTYAATDGMVPENVEIEWAGDEPDPAHVVEVLEAVFALAQRRPDAYAPAELAAPVPRCRRLLCGHPRYDHAATDAAGRRIGRGAGQCQACGDGSRCASFVDRDPVGFVAGADLKAGEMAGPRDAGHQTIVPWVPGEKAGASVEFVGSVAEDIDNGDLLMWAARETGPAGFEWKRR